MSNTTTPLPLLRTQGEVDETMNLAAEGMDAGSKWPGMSYEEGVHAALLWMSQENANNPMVEEPSSSNTSLFGPTRTQEEVDEAMNLAAEGMDAGSKWPGMSYEEGVHAALLWMSQENANNPMLDQ